ncbi:unnamed protein product [Dibothriocephalus latus]|uniref:Uncharacterized protein n=1 Tax=Dibothriocephalus latus TaxID=60516 RepID=A0A3P7LST5_DIBLA|nr:unnamed protein product [Dibothriocephalus latus]
MFRTKNTLSSVNFRECSFDSGRVSCGRFKGQLNLVRTRHWDLWFGQYYVFRISVVGTRVGVRYVSLPRCPNAGGHSQPSEPQ